MNGSLLWNVHGIKLKYCYNANVKRQLGQFDRAKFIKISFAATFLEDIRRYSNFPRFFTTNFPENTNK